MRINQFIAHNSDFSRREADELIKQGLVKIGKASQYSKTKLALNPHDKANPLKFTQFCLKFSEFMAFFAIMPL